MGDSVGHSLKLINVSKSFGGVRALRDVSFEARGGEVHALVGENGAGKSTLISIVAGAVERDEGELWIGDELVADATPSRMRSLGVAVIHQQPSLFPHVSVAENIALGWEERRATWWINHAARRERARDVLERIGAAIDPGREAGTLSWAQQQLVEIARALASNAAIMLFDEPTAGLGVDDARRLFEIIRSLRARGCAIVYISHRLEELQLIADSVSVLRDGRHVATRAMRELARADIVSLMVGREYAEPARLEGREAGDVLMELRGVSCEASGVRGVSLSLRAGEVLGIAGLVGSGRTEMARIITGHCPCDAGEILIDGRSRRIGSPLAARGLGIGYLPEDRRRDGVIGAMSVRENIAAGVLDTLSKSGMLDSAGEETLARESMVRYDVRPANARTLVSSLSGGNQQKVSIAQRAATRPRVFVLDEPTQGVDVAAKAEIHRVVRDIAAQGVGVLMISSDLGEILAMSDRVGVMRGGRLVGVLGRGEATAETVMSLAVGGEG